MTQRSKSNQSVLVGVDVGSVESGVTLIVAGQIEWGGQVNNDLVYHFMADLRAKGQEPMVIIEDMAPYSGQISPHTIATCKFIGELEYRLKVAAMQFLTIPRSKIKEWVYNSFTALTAPLVVKKMQKEADKGKIAVLRQDGELKAPSFIWVDDKIVIAAMRDRWGIPSETGKRNRYGWSKESHAWQALALVTWYIDTWT